MKNSPVAFRILLVDDNLLGSDARKTILSGQGYTVETARSGEEAWEIFQTQHFDIIVTDYKMPGGMTGSELIARIRATLSPSRVILLSGRTQALGLTEKTTGADDVIAKGPNEVPELLRSVKRLCALPRRRTVASQKTPATAKPRAAHA